MQVFSFSPWSKQQYLALSGRLLTSGLLAAIGCLSLLQPTYAQYTPEAIHNYNQGIEAYGQGYAADALKKFQRAVQIDPAYGDAYYNMGSIYYQMKQYDLAAEMFQKAVNLSPADNQAKYNLALSLEKLTRNEEAVNILSQIPPSDPKAAQAKAKIDELRPSLKPQSGGMKTATTPVDKNKSVVTTTPSAKPAATTTTATKPAPAAVSSTTTAKVGVQSFSKGYDGPTGITIGPGGFMYVANYSKNLIYRVGANGDKTVFAQGEALKGPIGLVYNAKANELYVANYLLGNVVRVSATGKISTLASGLNKPYNLFLDTVNNTLYVSEQDPANQISRLVLPH